MWVLRHIKSGVSHALLPNKEYTVGRKDTNILIENDPSISRKHAVLLAENLQTTQLDPANKPILKLRDSGSKYGTYKNSLQNRIGNNEEILVEGDTVIFGQFESHFRVCFESLIVTTSCIDSDKKKELKGVLNQLGGYLVSEWRPSCTHLVMTDIKITIKAVCCLVSLKPIVTVEYFTALMESLQSETAQPVASRYIPPIGEPLIDKEKASFDVVSERKQLFESKTFVFLDKKQFKKMNFAVILGGGKATLIEEREASLDFLLQPGTCVVQPSTENQKGSQPSPYVAEMSANLKRKERRMIPESDFGLAVAYCSTEKFCNPDFSIASTLFSSSRIISQTLSQCEVYVADTQQTTESPKKNFLENKSTIEETAEMKQQNASPGTSGGKEKYANIDAKENLNCGENKTIKIREREDSDDEPRLTYKRIKTEKVIQNISTDTQIKKKDNLKLKSEESLMKLISPVKLEPSSPVQMETEKPSKCIDSLDNSFNQPNLFSAGESSKVTSLFKKPKVLGNLDATQFSKAVKPNCNKSIPDIPNRNLCGFLNTREVTEKPLLEEEQNTADDDLPRNLIKVLVADLVCRKVNRSLSITENKCKSVSVNTAVKNFKRFKKVLPVGARVLPQIIGGHELEPYTKHSTKAIDDWLNEKFETQPEEGGDDDSGEFDWESQRTRKRKR